MTPHEKNKRRALIVRLQRARNGETGWTDARREHMAEVQRQRWARLRAERTGIGQDELDDLEVAGGADADLADLPDAI